MTYRRRCLCGIVALLGVAVWGGCDGPTEPEWAVPEPPNVRPFVAGEALERVDEAGHFVLPAPETPSAEPIIPRRRASQLALAWARTWPGNPNAVTPGGLGSVRERLEADHGKPIDWEALRLDARVAFYAVTPYEPLPDTASAAQRRFWGPHYLVQLYSEGVQAISLSVAAYATDLAIDSRGFVVLGEEAGNEFASDGVPKASDLRVPLWPEQAVRIVAETTRARVVRVPRLIQAGQRRLAQTSRWELVLDRDVALLHGETGERTTADTIYVGLRGRRREDGTLERWTQWYVPEPVQPAADSTLGDNIPVRDGVPLLFDEVSPVT